MARTPRPAAWRNLVAALQQLLGRLRNRRERPPPAGVREPRRPKPTLPAAAVALKEPRTSTARRIRLTSRRSGDRE